MMIVQAAAVTAAPLPIAARQQILVDVFRHSLGFFSFLNVTRRSTSSDYEAKDTIILFLVGML